MLRNYDANALWQADLDHCIHPWTDFSDWPRTGSTIMVRGEGAHVWNAEGEKFIDGIGGLWFANVGFGRQELIDAATRQLGMLPQYSYFTDIGNPPATELAAKLAELAPGDLNHVFYSTGGSVANDTAVRIAHFYFSCGGQAVEASHHLAPVCVPRQHLSRRRAVGQGERQDRLPVSRRSGAPRVGSQLLPDARRRRRRVVLLRLPRPTSSNARLPSSGRRTSPASSPSPSWGPAACWSPPPAITVA